MNQQMNRRDTSQCYVAGFLGLLAGVLATWVFKYAVYDSYFRSKRFSDYGPTLFAGGDPAVWTVLYAVLISISFVASCVFYLLFLRRPRLGEIARQIPTSLMVIVVSCLGVTVVPLKLATISGSPWGIVTGSVGLLICLAVAWCMLRFQTDRIARVFQFVLYSVFGTILLLQAPKLNGMYYLIVSSGEQCSFLVLLLAVITMIIGIAYIASQAFEPKDMWRILALLVAIYVLSIMEGRMYWSSDGFHDAEGFLSASILTAKSHIYDGGIFVPFHGYFRNIWPSYAAVLIQPDNYFIYRLTEALLVPLVNVCMLAAVVALTRKLAVGIAVFCFIYIFRVFIPFDNELLLSLAVLLSLLRPETGWRDKLLRGSIGLILLLLSLVSFELMLFGNIAMLALLVKIILDHLFGSERASSGLADALITHFVYYGCAVILVAANFDRSLATLQLLSDSFAKSPNLLERDVILSGLFEPTWFFIFAFGPVAIWFYLGNLSTLVRFDKRTASPEWAMRILASIIFLMFFIRAFNRSDDGHFLYALAISVPLAIGYLIRDRPAMVSRFVSICSVCLLGLFANDIVRGGAPIDRLKQAAWFDSRITRDSIRPMKEIGLIRAPVGVIGEALISAEELQKFTALRVSGYGLFDMINMPTVFYGVLGFHVRTRDYCTLFLNTYKEQKEIIQCLQKQDKALIAWSANYWTETLDYTYVETRLPLITQFVARQFQYVYKVGRFLVLSKNEVPELDGARASSNDFRRDYNLGKAPAKMAPYREERITNSIRIMLPDTIANRPDALMLRFDGKSEGMRTLNVVADGAVMVSVCFDVGLGVTSHFIRLSNLPRYNLWDGPSRMSVLDERGQDATGCEATGVWCSRD